MTAARRELQVLWWMVKKLYNFVPTSSHISSAPAPVAPNATAIAYARPLPDQSVCGVPKASPVRPWLYARAPPAVCYVDNAAAVGYNCSQPPVGALGLVLRSLTDTVDGDRGDRWEINSQSKTHRFPSTEEKVIHARHTIPGGGFQVCHLEGLGSRPNLFGHGVRRCTSLACFPCFPIRFATFFLLSPCVSLR